MNLEQLIKLRNELEKKLEKVKIELSINNLDLNERNVDQYISSITKEIIKLNNIIDICKVQDQKYIIMKLERLYMMVMSGLGESEFNKLSEEKMFEIFDNFFPDEWVYKYSIEQKEQVLLNCILNNKKINSVEIDV